MGQHRDLKINYDYLKGIHNNIKAYIDALSELRTASKKFVNVVKEQEGETFSELNSEFEDSIVINNSELIDILTDVYNNLSGYMEDMQSYISPENSAAICRVDRNDISWNIWQIECLPYDYIDVHPCVPSHSYWDEFVNPLADNAAEVRARNEEKKRKRERNYNKLVDFYNNTLSTTVRELSAEVKNINSIYDNYIVEYENTDDTYKSNLDTLYDSIKTWKDVLEDLWNGTKDFFRGFGKGVIDLLKGLKAPLEIIVALNPLIPLPLGVRVALLYDGGKDLYAAGKAFIEDPENTVGAIFQGIADTSDEEGVAFSAGYVTEKVVEVILAKKLGEAVKGSGATEAAAGAEEIHNPVLDSPRTGSALKVDDIKPLYEMNSQTGKIEMIQEFPSTPQAHGFTNIVDNYAGMATETSLGNATLYQVEGSLNGVAGRFEWIIQDGYVTHRMFIQNGTMNGVPIIQ